jgi:cell division protein ZapD
LVQNLSVNVEIPSRPQASLAAAERAASDPKVLYEYPLNERVRTLLRLEDLFDRFELFSSRAHPLDHHVALTTLFEMLEVTARGDLRSEMLQEFERQRQTLNGLRGNPEVNAEMLERTLARIDESIAGLGSMSGRPGQHLRDNEWLMSIRSRTGIAGGTCEFDHPSYHAWQHQSVQDRQQDIAAWAGPLAPLRFAIAVMLGLLRSSGHWSAISSQQGNSQHSLGGRTYQLVQVRLRSATGAIPEISANRYLLFIRFMTQDGDLRPRPYDGEVDFELALCNF